MAQKNAPGVTQKNAPGAPGVTQKNRPGALPSGRSLMSPWSDTVGAGQIMSGNVREWCQDGLRTYRRRPRTDPTGDLNSSDRVVRGGELEQEGACCRAAFRSYMSPAFGPIGFRAVCVVSKKK